MWNCTLILSSGIREICEELSEGMNSYAGDDTIHGR
jgi:hypothetical protein